MSALVKLIQIWGFEHHAFVHKPVLCLAESYEELYCFAYKPNTDEEGRQQEWGFLDLKAEYSRMGLPNSLWKLSSVNQHYKVREPTSLPSCTIFFILIWAGY